ncbi:MAG: hypothetical protein PWQ54_1914 [Bacteroidales bacterium]|nr:hypothetical protein [Bacteroidales bacterium]
MPINNNSDQSTMQIHFSHHFDSGYALDYNKPENQKSFNKVYLGPLGLLALLERLLACSGLVLSPLERLDKYRTVLAEHLKDNPNAFYNKSFARDPKGVTHALLAERDDLLMSGWNTSFPAPSPKLKTLVALEASGMIPAGPPDRWLTVIKAITNYDSDFSEHTFLLYEDPELYHPFYRNLFQILQDKGAIVNLLPMHTSADPESNIAKAATLLNSLTNKAAASEKKEKLEFSPLDNSLRFLRFKDDLEAAEFLATQKNWINKAVLINNQNLRFDLFSSGQNNFLRGSSLNKSHITSAQLIRLMAALYEKPVNINTLMAYLQHSPHPLPASLRNKLVKVLADKGGINNDSWNEIILNYFETYPEVSDRKIFIEMIPAQENRLNLSKIFSLHKKLDSWLSGKVAFSEDTVEKAIMHHMAQLNRIILNNFNRLQIQSQESIDAKELINLISDWYEPLSINVFLPQQHAAAVVNNPAQLIGSWSCSVWFDFNSPFNPIDSLSLLNTDELNSLKRAGLQLWETEAQLQAWLLAQLKAFTNTTDQLIVILTEKHLGEKTKEHPFLAFLKTNSLNLDQLIINFDQSLPAKDLKDYGLITPQILSVKPQQLPAKELTHSIKKGDLIRLRTQESYSSIEKLIYHPFSWVLQYAAGISDKATLQPAQLSIVMGNVAHKYIEYLLTKGMAEAKTRHKNFTEVTEKIIHQLGLILLLDENRFLKERFLAQLNKASSDLISFIEMNNLKVIGLEKELTAEKGVLHNQPFTGIIDLLLENQDKMPVIIDLKWSHNEKKYSTKVEKDEALQLTLYQRLVQLNSPVDKMPAAAYFLLAESSLITAFHFIGKKVINVKAGLSPNENLIRINNAINYRLNQLKKGTIEEADGMPLIELDYVVNTETKNLQPLLTEKKNKKTDYYSNYEVFRGELI